MTTLLLMMLGASGCLEAPDSEHDELDENVQVRGAGALDAARPQDLGGSKIMESGLLGLAENPQRPTTLAVSKSGVKAKVLAEALEVLSAQHELYYDMPADLQAEYDFLVEALAARKSKKGSKTRGRFDPTADVGDSVAEDANP